MASPTVSPATATVTTTQSTTPKPQPESNQEVLSSSSVEMRTLQASSPSSSPTDNVAQVADTPATASIDAPTPYATQNESPRESELTSSTPANPPLPHSIARTDTEAIGPSTDTPAANPDNADGPVLVIMLLLTTGARHPYKIDEKYLTKRNVAVEAMDPYNISVYTLKELIWRDWREEWEARPTSPTSIRLIHFGRLLDDKSPLRDCRFQTDTPNVVHMTVKPQEVVDEEENAKTGKGTSRRDGEDEPTAGCRCVIL